MYFSCNLPFFPLSEKFKFARVLQLWLVNCSYMCMSIFFILYTLAFGKHFCGSFGKPKNGAICMFLFYM